VERRGQLDSARKELETALRELTEADTRKKKWEQKLEEQKKKETPIDSDF